MSFTVLLAVLVMIMLVGIFTQFHLRGNLQRSLKEPDQVPSVNVPATSES